MDHFKLYFEHLEQGGMLLYPTETVWGLGVRADSSEAIQRLNDFKGRAPGQPMSVLVPHRHLVQEYAIVPEFVEDLMSIFWPGNVTFVLPARENVLEDIHGDTGFVGMRCSSHPFVKAFMNLCSFPVTTTSANKSGERPGSCLSDFSHFPESILKPTEMDLELTPFSSSDESSLVVKFEESSKKFQILRSSSNIDFFEKVAKSFGFQKK